MPDTDRETSSAWSTYPPDRSGYYFAVPAERGDWLDGTAPEVVYLYFNGKWSVVRPGYLKGYPFEAFTHWSGPISLPGLPPGVDDDE